MPEISLARSVEIPSRNRTVIWWMSSCHCQLRCFIVFDLSAGCLENKATRTYSMCQYQGKDLYTAVTSALSGGMDKTPCVFFVVWKPIGSVQSGNLHIPAVWFWFLIWKDGVYIYIFLYTYIYSDLWFLHLYIWIILVSLHVWYVNY